MLVQQDRSNEPRWKDGERLDHLFEQRCDQLTATASRQAVVTDDGR